MLDTETNFVEHTVERVEEWGARGWRTKGYDLRLLIFRDAIIRVTRV